MICINDHSSRFENELYKICRSSPYGAVILSYYNSYLGGEYSFLDFWIQRDIDEKAVCVFCKYYSTMTICGEASDPAEVESFIGMIYPCVLLCNDYFTVPHEYQKKSGETMICKKTNSISNPISNYDIVRIESNLRELRNVYDLLVLSSSEEECMPDFESYYLDISQKLRHGNAEVYAVKDAYGRIISTAALEAITEDTAVIGGVATSFPYRKNGYASALVRHITQKEISSGRSVYLYRDKKIPIYEKIGFETVGYHAQYRLINSLS